MIKAILADDEAIILNGLKKLINWEKLGIEIVGEASDGEAALEMIRKLNPQLVISDIAMPGLSGLEMLKKIQEHDLETKVIFVSGYQEFSYARDAVRYGAVDYLLKPVEREELEAAICKAIGMIDDQSKLSILEVSRTEDKVHQLFQKINGTQEYAREDLYEEFAGLNISVEGKQFLGIAFRLYLTKQAEKNPKMQELLKFSVYNKIQKKLEASGRGFMVKKSLNSCYAILILEKCDDRKSIETRIRNLAADESNHQKVMIKIGVGEKVDDIGALQLAYKTSRFALELYYFTEEDLIWYEDLHQEFKQSFEDYQECYQKLLHAFLNRQDSVCVEVNQVLKVIRSLHYGNRFAVQNRCNLMLAELTQSLCDHYLLDQTWIQEGEQCMEQIRLAPTYRQTCNMIMDYMNRVHKQIKQGGSSEYNEIVRIRRYIEEHFRENLSLESMAQEVGMNPFYFSSYFKKNLGMNFKTYLTDVRMREAEQMLVNTDCKVYEIAERVGYKNVRQFNENFRGKYGKSPNEYRKDQSR